MILVAYGLQFYLLGLVFHSHAGDCGARLLRAAKYLDAGHWWASFAMSANVALSFAFVGRLSFGGLALANSVATTAETVLLIWLISRRMGGLHWRSLAVSALRTLGAALAMAAAVWAWGRWVYVNVYLDGAPALNDDWLTAVGGALLAVLLYAGMAWLLRSAELRMLVEAVRARLRR
jgi:peptidoglycan biosynthesis protein MviN/MurJ (putative lipid II flippase)